MPDTVDIPLIFDPHGIYDGPGTRICGYSAERRAFAEINSRLSRAGDEGRHAPLVYVIGGASVPHFDSYRRASGVRIEDLSPRSRAAAILGQSLPGWISDSRICEWGLLGRQPPTLKEQRPIEEQIAEWLIPGATATANLSDWLRSVSSSPVVEGIAECSELWEWFLAKFGSLLRATLGSDPIVADLVDDLRNGGNPTVFSREWCKRRALLPLYDTSPSNPLRCAAVDGSVRSRFLAKRLPLLFPLFPAAHGEVSEQYVQALRKARNLNPDLLEAAAKALNAIWDGVDAEIITWIQLRPNALTTDAVTHLKHLPGCTARLHEVLTEYGPPTPVPPWPSSADGAMAWLGDYSKWLRTSFLRRQLPDEANDPATGFSKWLKANLLAAFSNPATSYLAVASRIRSALSEGRAVIVVMIDAMAVHVSDTFSRAITRRTGSECTTCEYLFSPVPTITEVCKSAILTGRFPSQAAGDLADIVCQSYGLTEDELVLAGSWEDPARLKVAAKTRLVMYRDNRLDGRLHMVGGYRELLDDCRDIAERVAGEMARLTTDLRCLTGSNPLLLLTADHGFTYGPPPAPYTASHRQVDPGKRCIALATPPTPAESGDDSLTVIGTMAFHTGQDYLAARGRYFGTQTVTGWKLAHGGLLPEEVFIPFYEWYGTEAAVHWPSLETVGEAYCEEDVWHLRVRLRNRAPAAILGGELRVSIVGAGQSSAYPFGRLSPSQVADVYVEVPAGPLTPSRELVLETNTTVVLRDGSKQTLPRTLSALRAKQLIERTRDQEEFESMF